MTVAPVSETPASSLGDLYAEHRPFVRSCLHRMGVGSDCIEDAEQDVFLVLVRRIADYDGRHAHRSWLWGIAQRVAWTHRRKARRAPVSLARAPMLVERPVVDERLTVERFLSDLDEDQLAVYLLHELHGHSAREIADKLDLRLTTVQWRIRSARSRLARASAPTRLPGCALGFMSPWALVRRWKMGGMASAKLAVAGGAVSMALVSSPGEVSAPPQPPSIASAVTVPAVPPRWHRARPASAIPDPAEAATAATAATGAKRRPRVTAGQPSVERPPPSASPPLPAPSRPDQEEPRVMGKEAKPAPVPPRSDDREMDRPAARPRAALKRLAPLASSGKKRPRRGRERQRAASEAWAFAEIRVLGDPGR